MNRKAPPCHIVGGIDQPGLALHYNCQQAHAIYTPAEGIRPPVIARDHAMRLHSVIEKAWLNGKQLVIVEHVTMTKPAGAVRWSRVNKTLSADCPLN